MPSFLISRMVDAIWFQDIANTAAWKFHTAAETGWIEVTDVIAANVLRRLLSGSSAVVEIRNQFDHSIKSSGFNVVKKILKNIKLGKNFIFSKFSSQLCYVRKSTFFPEMCQFLL